MNRYWVCIKGGVEGICIYTLVALSFILKHIGKYGEMKIVTQQNSLKGKEDKALKKIMIYLQEEQWGK